MSVIENVYPKNETRNIVPENKILISPSRDIFLKNKITLEKSFGILKKNFPDILLDTGISEREKLLERINKWKLSGCAIFSEVSPNIVIDAISVGTPCVVTEDCGIKDRLGDLVVWVDPKDAQSIADGIASLMNKETYGKYLSRMSEFSFVHTPEEIAEEFISISKKI